MARKAILPLAILVIVGGIGALWLVSYLGRPHLRVVQRRVLPPTHDVRSSNPSGFPLAEFESKYSSDPMMVTDPYFDFRSIRMCWLNPQGGYEGAWQTLPASGILSVSPKGGYVSLLHGTSDVWVGARHAAFQHITRQRVDAPLLISDAGMMHGANEASYYDVQGAKLSIPRGWRCDWGMITLSDDPQYILLRRQIKMSGWSITNIYGLYDWRTRTMRWQYKRISGLSTGHLGSVFFAGNRSTWVSEEEVAIFDGSQHIDSFLCPPQVQAMYPGDARTWRVSADGSIWAFDKTNIYILLWRSDKPSIRTIPIAYETSEVPVYSIPSIAVWGDGHLIARTENIVKRSKKTGRWTVGRKLAITRDDVKGDRYTVMPSAKNMAGEYDFDISELAKPISIEELLAFSADGQYLAWKIGPHPKQRELIVFQVR